MSEKAKTAARSAGTRVRAVKGAHAGATGKGAIAPRSPDDAAEWVDPEDGTDRLAEEEMEILLTGHAASHGVEGDDNWMLETTRHDID